MERIRHTSSNLSILFLWYGSNSLDAELSRDHSFHKNSPIENQGLKLIDFGERNDRVCERQNAMSTQSNSTNIVISPCEVNCFSTFSHDEDIFVFSIICGLAVSICGFDESSRRPDRHLFVLPLYYDNKHFAC